MLLRDKPRITKVLLKTQTLWERRKIQFGNFTGTKALLRISTNTLRIRRIC